jgi:hypothetical protein
MRRDQADSGDLIITKPGLRDIGVTIGYYREVTRMLWARYVKVPPAALSGLNQRT